MAGRTGTEGLLEDLAWQRERVLERCPPYARALELLPGALDGPAGRFLAAAWQGRTFHAPYGRPLLLLAALRHDALAEGPGHPLHAAFSAEPPDAGAATEDALRAALDGARERLWDAIATRAVSTNETSRAVAWLWPAALAGASSGARPLALADVGASAGLNLVADLLPPIWTDEEGAPLEVVRDPRTVARLGLDPAPLDALKPEDADWLRACVWPGDRDRAERLEAALVAYARARPRPDAPVLAPVSARAVPARLDALSRAEPGALVLAYQTIVRDFLDPAERDEYEGGMREWLAAQPLGRALWVDLEPAAGGTPDLPASIHAHARAAGGAAVVTLELARCGYHPRRIVRNAAEVAALRELLAHGAAIAAPASPA
jgi:hypothetical protein